MDNNSTGNGKLAVDFDGHVIGACSIGGVGAEVYLRRT